jgi:hypothetical protein
MKTILNTGFFSCSHWICSPVQQPLAYKGWGYENKLKQIGDQMQARCGICKTQTVILLQNNGLNKAENRYKAGGFVTIVTSSSLHKSTTTGLRPAVGERPPLKRLQKRQQLTTKRGCFDSVQRKNLQKSTTHIQSRHSSIIHISRLNHYFATRNLDTCKEIPPYLN